MNVSILQAILGLLTLSSWIVTAATGLLASRTSRARALGFHVASFFLSAFTTRLAIEHHQSRSQIACFLVGAALVELLRGRRGGSFVFWAAAGAAVIMGTSLARPIAHRYAVSTW